MIQFDILDFAQELIAKCIPVKVQRINKSNLFSLLHKENINFPPMFQYYMKRCITEYFEQCETAMIHKIVTPLQTQYYALCLSKEHDEHLLMGPVLEDPITDHFIYPIINNLHLTMDYSMKLKLYYQSIPTIEPNVLFEVLYTVNQYVTKEYTPPKISTLDLSILPKENTSYDLYLQDMNRTAMYKILEERYAEEDKMLSYISSGDVTLAQLHWGNQSILNSEIIRTKDSLRNAKNLLMSGNTLFRKAAHKGGVHPVYLDELSGKWAIKIEQASSFELLDQMPLQMIRSYCLLTKNHSVSKYPPMIQKAITFIHLNLSSNLTVKKLANEVGLSPDYLTRLFKKELGMTVIAYINQKRIHNSIKLLNTTNLSIEEIGDLVGLSNTSYFYTLFKKEIGISPNQYRNQLKSK